MRYEWWGNEIYCVCFFNGFLKGDCCFSLKIYSLLGGLVFLGGFWFLGVFGGFMGLLCLGGFESIKVIC